MAFNRLSFRAVLIAGLSLACAGLFAAPAAARARVGVLECNIAPGIGFIITSDQALSCRFNSVNGWTSYYVGTIRKFGLDIGFSGPQRLVWAVFAPSEPGVHHALAGEYVGATGDVSIGAGLGANVLVGGSARSVALQPVSVSADTGLNIAAGVGDLVLIPARGPHP
jgi:Protein of unknown function (DUF992)